MILQNATDPVVVINTNYGAVFVELFQGQAPITVANFLSYVNQGFYSNTLIHRVDLSNEVVQVGGFQVVNGSLQAKSTSAPIDLENTGYKNIQGTIGMARTVDPNSATSQFYFNLTDNPGFDGNGSTTGYTVFGAVVGGWNVVHSISQVMTYSSIYPAFYQTLPYTLVDILASFLVANPNAMTTATPYQIKQISDLGNTPVVVLTGQRADFSIVANQNNSLDIQNITGSYASVHISNADRVVFYNFASDTYTNWLAYDTQADVGFVAELIGTGLGRDYIGVSKYVQFGLSYLEQSKMSHLQLCDLVVSTKLFQQLAGGTDNTAFVNFVYKNVMGQTPDANTLLNFKGLLDSHVNTQGELLEMATQHSDSMIDLVGLSHTGILFG